MKNRLKQFMQKKVDKINARRTKKKKYTITEEARWCSEQMGVTLVNIWAWYGNKYQPDDELKHKLAELYGATLDKFFYKNIKIDLKS